MHVGWPVAKLFYYSELEACLVQEKIRLTGKMFKKVSRYLYLHGIEVFITMFFQITFNYVQAYHHNVNASQTYLVLYVKYSM